MSFNHQNNALEFILKCPKLISNNLVFSEQPLHIGNRISILPQQQETTFLHNELNNHLSKLLYLNEKKEIME